MAKQQKPQQGQQRQGPVIKRGIVTDTSYLNQPPGALTFALNTVNESEAGDEGWRSNEQSNKPCYTLPDGFTPIGQIYIGKDETVIFAVSQDEQTSLIGITGANCEFTILVRTYLGFKLTNQISGTYRLRRGCERMLYFTTPVPMVFNIDKPGDFKTGTTPENQNWDIDKFSLFKVYEKIPFFDSVEIIENGALEAGSYNVAIQYLDNDLNPTEWITTSEPIKIYHDSTSKEYEDVKGSTSVIDSITNYGITNKSIVWNFSNFDVNYPLYRVAIIVSNKGTGLVTAVNFSSPISINNPTFTYSGIQSIVTTGTEEEILAFNNIISSAEYVEQIENRLILGKTKGTQINFCNLQKYASRIKAQLNLSTVELNQFEPVNPKTADVNFLGTGYMPGEIYSFGIVYIFEDSSLSPVYHIPGRAEGFTSFMSNDNKCQTKKYDDISNDKKYWGLDSQGKELYAQPVRHHRFPRRTEINEPLYSQINVNNSFFINNLILNIQQPILDTVTTETIYFRVVYTVGISPNEQIITYNNSIFKNNYNPSFGIQFNVIKSRDQVVVNDVLESIDGITYTSVPIDGTASGTTGLVYTAPVVEQLTNNDTDLFSSRIMGIKFEGIDIPDKSDTNEIGVIGYYIVRNERTEGQKTILDSGVITPTLEQKKNFVAYGHVFPELADKTPIDTRVLGLIHPEHLFNGREYKNATTIKQEGEFVKMEQTRSSVVTQDVGAGTSYNPDLHKNGSNDNDGFSLHTFVRETRVDYNLKEERLLDPFQKGDIFYLNALNFNTIEQDGAKQDVYNVSGDNKIGIINMDKELNSSELYNIYDRLPYVILSRVLSNPYGNFRTIPYFKDTRNPIYFDKTEEDVTKNGSTVLVRNGDSYIVPIKYNSSVFYNFRLAGRETKSGTWKIIVGAILVVAGVIGAAFSGGASTPLIALGLSVAAAGYGISTIASGIETDQISKVYEEQYEAGLRDTILDDDTATVFGDPNASSPGPPIDDEMQWLSDVVTNLWFETGVNVGLRNGASIAITDYLKAPTNLGIEGFWTNSIGAAYSPVTPLDTYILNKLTTIDTDNGDGRLYKGYAGAELYLLSRDYIRTNKQKVYFHLGLEYDCDSACLEDFPHRDYYSEQSFQEELTDNYRVFLPNNYRDIEGEKGVITDVFRMSNNLYIHTEGALWHLPQNIQERVTGDVVSFIGTGSFFSIPPRKITDADKASAGTSHNWARMKTANGTFFVSADEGKVFLFDGNQLQPIIAGNENWFKHNLPLVTDYDFLTTAGLKYPLRNNPSNPFGTGFVSAYDTHKERFILTKKDYKLSQEIIGETDYNICINNGEFIIFHNYQALIDCMESEIGCESSYPELGGNWTYLGIEDCKMKFSKVETEIIEEERIVSIIIPQTADVWVALDMSDSFTDTDRQVIKDAALQWETNYRETLGWEGRLLFFEFQPENTESERWMATLGRIITTAPEYAGVSLNTIEIILMSFVNEASIIIQPQGLMYYHFPLPGTGYIPDIQPDYITDFSNFKTYQQNIKYFLGINYPIVYNKAAPDDTYNEISRSMLQQVWACYYAKPLTLAEASAIPVNPGYTQQQWDDLLISLQNTVPHDPPSEANPYPESIADYGWTVQGGRNSDGVGPVITPEQFATDLNEILAAEAEEITIIETTVVNTTVVIYIEGVVIEEPIDFDLGWTMSYSLKDKEWISWHSYIPNFYIYRLQEFYSWKHGLNDFYEHNIHNHYQTFYGELFPHILEYVDNKKPRETKVWDYLNIQSQATRFDETYQEDIDVDITFNKLIAYTSKQVTGLQYLNHKHDGTDYLEGQVLNFKNVIPIDRNERDWTINDLRDIMSDYTESIFRKDNFSLKNEYYIDKVLNTSALDYSKDWYDLQSFRDKYLVVRLIFDNFDNTRLVTNFTEEMDYKSFR